jgi:hypothetical protein
VNTIFELFSEELNLIGIFRDLVRERERESERAIRGRGRKEERRRKDRGVEIACDATDTAQQLQTHKHAHNTVIESALISNPLQVCNSTLSNPIFSSL